MKLDPAWIAIAVLAIASIGVFASIALRYAAELRRARQALHDARERMSTALTSLGVGVWEVDLRTHEVVWAENASGLLASPATIRTIDDILDRLHPDDRPVAMAIHAGSSFMTVGLPPGSSFSGSQRISPARDWKRPRFVLTPEWPDLDTCTQKHLGRPKTRELARFWRSRRGVQARLRASRMISTTIAVEPTRKSA